MHRLSAAIARLADTAADCVRLDLSLPDAGGLDGVQAMRRAFPGVPLVVLTGLNDSAVGEAAVALGAQDFLIKRGLTASALVRSVQYGVERHRCQSMIVAAQARFQLAFGASPIGMALVGPDGDYREVNPAWVEMLG